jgi:hypothetical protein
MLSRSSLIIEIDDAGGGDTDADGNASGHDFDLMAWIIMGVAVARLSGKRGNWDLGTKEVAR